MGRYQEKQRERDKAIIDYLTEYGCARTETLKELFFKNEHIGTCRIRLSKLHRYTAINRHRDFLFQEYIYYTTKPKQIEHRLILTDFHRELIKLGADVVKLENEFTFFDGIRPDGFLACRYRGKELVAFVECERQKPDTDKYEKFYISERWKVFRFCPKLIWITNKKVTPVKGMDLIIIKEDLSNIREVFNGF